MKNIIYAFLFLTLSISMAGKDPIAIKADSPAVTKAAKQEEIKTPPAPSIIRHDTVYVAVKEMPGDVSVYVSIAATLLTLLALWFSIRYSKKALETSQKAIDTSQKANDIADATLKEMEKQRIIAYKPLLEPAPIEVKYTKKNSSITFSFKKYNSEAFSDNDISISIFNIGKGTAKDIHTKWIFDSSAIVKLIDNIAGNGSEIKKEKSEKGKIRYSGTYLNNNLSKRNFSFRTPKSSKRVQNQGFLLTNSNKEILFPYYYFHLYRLLTNERDVQKIKNFVYPPLYMEVNYSNIEDKTYKDTYKLSLVIKHTKLSHLTHNNYTIVYLLNIQKEAN